MLKYAPNVAICVSVFLMLSGCSLEASRSPKGPGELDSGVPIQDGGDSEPNDIGPGDAGEVVDVDVPDVAEAVDGSLLDGGDPGDTCVVEQDVLCWEKCGELDDGCGSTVDCGTCLGIYNTCGGGGVPNVCGCPDEEDSDICTRLNLQCGYHTPRDLCGQTRNIECGDCNLDWFCVENTVIGGGHHCVDCSLDSFCQRPHTCPVPLYSQISSLRFRELKELEGITDQQKGCGFTTDGTGGWLAICSEASEISEHSRLRPQVFTSANGSLWVPQERPMVDIPSGYRLQEEGQYQTSLAEEDAPLFDHRQTYPITVPLGQGRRQYLALSTNFFSEYSGATRTHFVPFWLGTQVDQWEGYDGTAQNGDRYVVSFGHHPNSGVSLPAVFQRQNRSLVAYLRDAPHRGHPLENPGYHRYTTSPIIAPNLSQANLQWEKDEDFLLPLTAYENGRMGRIFVLRDDLYLYNFRQAMLIENDEEGAVGCTSDSLWYWAVSQNGEQDSFAPSNELIPWHVDRDCNDFVSPCDIETPFLVRYVNRARLFYFDSDEGSWFTALSDFRLGGMD